MQAMTPQSRRGFIKLAALSTAFAGLAGTGAAALARGRRSGPADPAEMEERLDRMLQRVYQEIDATDAQKQKIDPIVKQAATELRPLHAKAREARREGIKLFAADTVDPGAVERLRIQQIEATDATSRRFTQALLDVADVLTPAQRKAVAARFARRGPHRGS